MRAQQAEPVARSLAAEGDRGGALTAGPDIMRVLMLGPGEGVTGGIAALVETIRPALARRTELRYLATVSRRPLRESGRISLANLGRAVSQYARFAAALRSFRPDVVHVHTVVNPEALEWAAARGAVATVQDHRPFCPSRLSVSPLAVPMTCGYQPFSILVLERLAPAMAR